MRVCTEIPEQLLGWRTFPSLGYGYDDDEDPTAREEQEHVFQLRYYQPKHRYTGMSYQCPDLDLDLGYPLPSLPGS
jgi:hypothetical protein